MKTIFCTTLFLASFFIGKAQLTGAVLDTEGMPIAYANVMIYEHPGSELINGGITDENGRFEIVHNVSGSFRLEVRLLTYHSWVSEPFQSFVNNLTRDFGEIRLQEEVQQLEEVALIGRKRLMERTPEGNIINVQQSVLTKGSTALQVLERSPGVILDLRNNSFSLNGRSGTLVMINGKAQRMPMADIIAMLNGLSADTIEKIELLSNPSAKYDADGNAGIINIVLSSTEALGTNGNYSVSSGYGEGPKEAVSLSLNHGARKVSINGSYSYNYDDTFSQWRGVGSTEIPVFGGVTDIGFSSQTWQITRSHNSSVGIDYRLNDNISLGLSALYNRSDPTRATQNLGTYNFEVNPFLEAQIFLDGAGDRNNWNSSVYFEKKGAKNDLLFTLDYLNLTSSGPNEVLSQYFDEGGDPFDPENEIYNTGNRGINDTRLDVGVAQLDYSLNTSKKLGFEGGIKVSRSETSNDARIEILRNDNFITDERFLSQQQIQESIGAAYAIGKLQLDSTFNVEVGLRYEYWDRTFDDTSLNRSFGKLFPSVFLTKNFNERKSLNLSYTKRISRPDYADLASYLSYNSPTSVFSGNPNLLPAISNTVNLGFNTKGKNFNLGFTYEENPIARFQIEESPLSALAVIAPKNVDFQRSIDFQTNIPINPTNWWNINLNASAGIREFQVSYTPQAFSHDYWYYNLNGSTVFTVPWDLSWEISGFYTSEHFNGSTRVKGFGSLNTGLRKNFKNGGSLQFSITDVFRSLKIRSLIGSVTREAYNNIFGVRYLPESGNSQIFRLSYTQTFGNKKVKSSRQRNGASEERSRI